MNVLLAPLVDYFSQNEKGFGKLKVIKRGSGIMEMRYQRLIFRDFLNYSRFFIFKFFCFIWVNKFFVVQCP